jgi:hypothetical protein
MAVQSIPSPLAGWKREPFIGIIITASTSHTIIWESEANFTVSITKTKKYEYVMSFVTGATFITRWRGKNRKVTAM